MVNQYGDDTEPGIITEEQSTGITLIDSEAPSDVGIVGPADLANATNAATANKVYEITQDTTASERFGPAESSLLTTAVHDLLFEGVGPIYAIAPEPTVVTEEDHGSASQTTVSVDSAPCSEDVADWTVTLDDTDLTVNLTKEDVSTKAPDADECYVNPVEGELEVPNIPSSGLTVSYTHYDYTTALDAIAQTPKAADAIDMLTAVQENSAVQNDVVQTARDNSGEKNYMVAFVSPDAPLIDAMSWTNPYDSSRAQVVYPTRFSDGSSALAAYAGTKARIGIDGTVIDEALRSDKTLAVTLTREERGALIDEFAVPLKNNVGGAVIKDDKTAVTSDGSDERNIDYGSKRLVLDYIYATAEANETPFIGRLDNPGVRQALGHLIEFQLTALTASGAIDNFTVDVLPESATSARLVIDIDGAEPLRFVYNDVRIGPL